MEQKQNNHYNDLMSYMAKRHERNRKRIKYSGIVMVLLPVILGIVRWLTDSDKIVFLLIWVLCMFALSAYLISVEYIDHNMQKMVKGHIDSEDDAEKGGDE